MVRLLSASARKASGMRHRTSHAFPLQLGLADRGYAARGSSVVCPSVGGMLATIQEALQGQRLRTTQPAQENDMQQSPFNLAAVDTARGITSIKGGIAGSAGRATP